MNNLIQEDHMNNILKQSLMNGFKILLLIGFISLSLFSIVYFENSIDKFFVITFQNIAQVHPYIFMVLGYLLCGIFVFASSVLSKTMNKNIVSQKTINIFKSVAFFCFAYNILVTDLIFIYIFYFIFQNHNLTACLSYLFIFNSILSLSNALLFTFSNYHYLFDEFEISTNDQNQNSFDILKINNLKFKEIIALTFLGLFITFFVYCVIVFIPLSGFYGHYAWFILLIISILFIAIVMNSDFGCHR